MKRIAAILVMFPLVLAGCKKPQGPQTTELEAPPVDRPIQELMPEPAPAPAPGPTDVAMDEPEPLPPPAPALRTHTVRKGETLWSLSRTYLGDPKRWKEIVSLNPGLTPQSLPVGKTIQIPNK